MLSSDPHNWEQKRIIILIDCCTIIHHSLITLVEVLFFVFPCLIFFLLLIQYCILQGSLVNFLNLSTLHLSGNSQRLKYLLSHQDYYRIYTYLLSTRFFFSEREVILKCKSPLLPLSHLPTYPFLELYFF